MCVCMFVFYMCLCLYTSTKRAVLEPVSCARSLRPGFLTVLKDAMGISVFLGHPVHPVKMVEYSCRPIGACLEWLVTLHYLTLSNPSILRKQVGLCDISVFVCIWLFM